jgi:thioesterase domain-containing protein/acyl carrier protein
MPSGKIDRVALRTAKVDPWRSASPREPVDDLEATLGIVCAEVLSVDGVSPDDDLWELGLDSLEAVELVEAISELGWGRLPPGALLECTTPAAVAQTLRNQARRSHGPRQPSEIVVLNPDGDRAPIIALPGAGATAFGFHWIARALGPAQPVVVVEAHGLHTTGRPDRTVDAMAARAAATARARVTDGPIVLVGHSAGGLVAYAAAQQLSRAGHRVGVVMLDTPFPGMPRVAPAPAGAAPPHRRWLERLVRHPLAAVRRAPADLAVAVRKQWPGPPSTSPARYKAFTRIGADAARRYLPEPGDFPIVLLHPATSHAPATWAGWGAPIDPRGVRGTHLGMLRPPAVDDVVAQIVECRELLRAGEAGQ